MTAADLSKSIAFDAMPRRWQVRRKELSGHRVEFKAGGLGGEIELKESGRRAQICGAYVGNVDSGGDLIEPGAFDKTLKERLPKRLIKLFSDHECGLGEIDRAWWDGPRLWVEGSIPETEDGIEFRESVKSGLYAHGSIGYQVIQAERRDIDGESVRVLKEIKLWEVSGVTWPMNELAAGATIKALGGGTGIDPRQTKGDRWPADLWTAGDLLQLLGRIRWMLEYYELSPAEASLAHLCIDELSGIQGSLSALLGIEPDAAMKGAAPTPTEPPTDRIGDLLGELRFAARTIEAQIKRF